MADDKFKKADVEVAEHKEQNDPDEALKAKIKAEQEKYPNMPPKYVAFTIKWRCFWLVVNLIGIAASVGMAVGSVMILGRENDDKENTFYLACQSMEVVCWALFALHIVNAIFCLMSLCGLEKRFCISYVLLALVLFDGVVLVWAQTTYFQSQSYNCNIEMADVYFWLMGEILFFYCLTAFVLCYFFRKFCQDPALKKEAEDEELRLQAEKNGELPADKVLGGETEM